MEKHENSQPIEGEMPASTSAPDAMIAVVPSGMSRGQRRAWFRAHQSGTIDTTLMSDAEFQAWQVDISGVTQDGERYRCRYIFTPRQTRFHLLGPGADAPIEADDELLDLIDSYLKSGILVNLDGWSRDQVVALLFGEQ